MRMTAKSNNESYTIDPENGSIGTYHAINKLGEYEDVEEQGRLIKLPCAVGDTVYVIYDNYVATAIILAFYIDGCGGMLDVKIRTKNETVTGFETVIDKDNYTFDDVFMTIEEAENKLKETENTRTNRYKKCVEMRKQENEEGQR